MSSHQRNHTAVIRWLLFVCLLYSGSSLEAQIEAPTPVPTQEAPSKSNETSDDSELKIHNYQLKHAKAAEVLKLFKQLHGGENAVTIDERTNSIVFYSREAAATELLESLALLDGDAPHPIIPPTSVVQGSSPQAPAQAKYQPRPTKSKPAGPFRKFTFKHAKVADVVKILREVAPSDFDSDDMEGFVVDERTNSFIWKVDTVSLDFEEECKKLDTESPASLGKLKESASPYRPSDDIRSDGVSMSFQTLTISLEVDRSNTVESLKQRYNELEQQTHQLADKLKQSKSASEPERTELKIAVRKSFEARQALQRAELADLAQRMQSMQQSIDMRDKLADKVVQRRVEDLLNPNLKWDLLAAKERTLDSHNSELKGATTTTDQSAPNVSPVTPGDSASLPPSMAPAPFSVPYDPGKRPETIIMERIQGHWIAESMLSAGKNGLNDYSEPFGVWITGNEMRFKVGEQDLNGPIPMLLTGPKVSYRSLESADQFLPIDIIHDPNGEQLELPGIIASDGLTLSICYTDKENGFRPTSFIPGSKVTVIKCHRAPSSTVANKPDDADLSTPQATLDTIDRYSVDHPMGVPVECYTEPALQELSGVMLQQLCFMSGLSQVGLQTGGVIGIKDNAPIVAGTAPSFHLSVDALLKEHSLPTPPEECTKAFELLAKLTLGAAFGNDESLVKPDRELFRLAAGILKSPKEFLPKAGELSERFNDISGDTESPKKESKAQPKYLIKIDGDEATATQIVDSDKPSVPMSFKLQRINQRWLVSEAFSDEILNQMISSMSQVLGAMSAIEAEVAKQSDSSDSKKAPDAEGANNTSPREWDDFHRLLPESGTALVMFSYEPEIKEQMLPVAKKVAEAASAQLIELPLTQWRKILRPEATHFVLMKDRQLVGTRTGLMTEARLQDFIAKANDWSTPQSTGIDEDSLVRIDCFISPGTDNIGSQHGGAYPLTSVVVAVHEDQALLFGPDSIAEYIEKGYACVAVVRDAYGQQKQVPIDILLKGPVKLLGRSEKQPQSAASMNVTFGDGTSQEVPLPSVASIYPKSVTEPLETYDVRSAIYHIRGVQGLKPVRLAAIKDAPIINQRVLSGSFARERHVPPLHGFRSPIHWQSQTVQRADGGIYGGNINGAEMFEVLCPTRPAPCGFTFNEQGRLIGMYGLGVPSEKDMTHSVFRPDSTHSVLQAALEKISDAGLKAALAQTLEESHESLKTSMKVPSDAGETVNPLYSGHPISWWLDSYWDNATASPKTAENSAQEYVASEAIRKLRELPECKTAIETALEKWFASVEHEVNEIQLTRAAKCIVFAAGPKNQKLAVDYLFEIAKRVPINPGEEDLGKWIDCWDDELDKAVKELVLNDELATQIADRLQTGNSAQRRFAVTFLLNRGASKQSDTPDQTEANAWFRSHDKLFYPAFEAALQDSSEAIRMFALIVLTGIDPHNSQLPFQLKRAVESDPSTQVRCVAIPLLCSKELAYSIEAQSVELQPLLMKALEADSSVDVRDAALGALMAMDKDSELVHATLLEWARCKERLQVEYALTLMLRNHEAGDRPQSIDELIELLSDPEWGTKVEVNYNNWSTHHRWARQYAIAILGQYAAHAHRALPTLEAELARNNKDTLSFATVALDRVRGYCPDLPIDKLQGEWEFVSLQKPEGSLPFFELQASSDQQPSTVITISGTQLKLGDRVLAELSHYRSGSRQGVALLLDPDGKKRHCHGGHNFKGVPSPENNANATPAPELLILEVSELLNNWDATQATKQIYEFRRVIGERRLEAPTP